MAPRRVLAISIAVIGAAALFILRNHHDAQAQNATLQPPSIYTCVYLKGEALRKAVIDDPAILTQLNPEGKSLLSLIFSYQKPSDEDIEMLLRAGADARSTDYHGNGALHVAAVQGTPKTISLLVKAGADVNQANQRGITPLRAAAQRPGDSYKDNVEALLSLGAHLDMFSSAALGKTSELQELISADPDSINEEDDNHYSPIDWAVMRHQTAVLKVIADSNPKINIFRAAAIGDQSTVKADLRKAPGTINTTDQHDRTPLDWAVLAENTAMVKFLLEHDADPNTSRPLLLVARNGNVEITRLLLDHGADPSDPKKKFTADQLENINPFQTVDPYQWAMNSHHPDVAELIKAARK